MQSAINYTLFLVLPLSLYYFSFSSSFFILVGLLHLSFIILTYYTSDTLVLYFLKAREITGLEIDHFFQPFKNESYKRKEVMPKFYLYSGLERKFILLQNKNNMSLILDRKFFSSMDEDGIRELAKIIYQMKESNNFKRQTFGMALNAIFLFFIYLIIRFPLWRKTKVEKLVLILLLIVAYPFIQMLKNLTSSRKCFDSNIDFSKYVERIHSGQNLKHLFEYILKHAEDSRSLEEIFVVSLEQFPSLEMVQTSMEN